METILEKTKANFELFLEKNEGRSVSFVEAVSVLQVKAQLAVADEIKQLRELLADQMKRGGALNR